MARDRRRVRLEDGLRLSLPKIMRDGLIRRGEAMVPRIMRWVWTYTDEEAASLVISGSLEGESHGWLRLHGSRIDQHLELTARPRRFGGLQWYFVCPYKGVDASVLWRPPGARQFASRAHWGRQVAYGSQFETPYSRAITQAQKIRTRIGGPEWASLDEDFPPKPKGMRWATYDRITERCAHHEAVADVGLSDFVARFLAS